MMSHQCNQRGPGLIFSWNEYIGQYPLVLQKKQHHRESQTYMYPSYGKACTCWQDSPTLSIPVSLRTTIFRGICTVNHSTLIEYPKLNELCLFVGLVVSVVHRRLRREAISKYPDAVPEKHRNPGLPRLNSVFPSTSFVFAEAEKVLRAVTSNPLHVFYYVDVRGGIARSPNVPGLEDCCRFDCF